MTDLFASLEKFSKNLFLAGLLLLCISYFQKDKFPQVSEILPQLYKEPSQAQTQTQPFSVKKRGFTYNITPIYNYELYGMVVSYHLSSVWWDYYHNEEWKDYLNFKDIGFIWGDNLKSGVYRDMKFRSQSWTLYWSPRSCNSVAWSKFKSSEASNNHILASDPEVEREIMQAEKGDQVYMKGYLVNYSNSANSGDRKSSTVRDDSGCEVVFVTDFKVLKKSNVLWRFLYTLSKYFVFAGFFGWLVLWYRKASLESPQEEDKQWRL